MPAPTTTVRLFTSQTFGSLGVALPNIIRFLISDNPLFTGPNWTLVEAYSQGQAAREVPSNAHDLDSLVTTNAWASGTQVTGSWVVLENSTTANIGENSNHFQLYIEYDTTTILNFMLIPFANFVTGGTAQTPPQFPTSSFGTSSGSFTVHTITGATASGTYSAVADESMFYMTDNLVRLGFYVGEINSAMKSGSVGETRPYVIKRTAAVFGWSSTSLFARLSPFDNITVLTSSFIVQAQISSDGSNIIHDDLADDRFNQNVLPVGLLFTDNNHKNFSGWFKNIYSAADGLLQSGTINTPSGYFMHTGNSAGAPQIACAWNSSSYGSASIGTLCLPPEMENNNFAYYFIDSDSTGSGGTTTTVTVNAVPTGSFDRNRLRITYPANRRRRRNANVIG